MKKFILEKIVSSWEKRLIGLSSSFSRHRIFDKISIIVSLCIFKETVFVNLGRALTRAVPSFSLKQEKAETKKLTTLLA